MDWYLGEMWIARDKLITKRVRKHLRAPRNTDGSIRLCREEFKLNRAADQTHTSKAFSNSKNRPKFSSTLLFFSFFRMQRGLERWGIFRAHSGMSFSIVELFLCLTTSWAAWTDHLKSPYGTLALSFCMRLPRSEKVSLLDCFCCRLKRHCWLKVWLKHHTWTYLSSAGTYQCPSSHRSPVSKDVKSSGQVLFLRASAAGRTVPRPLHEHHG